MGALQKLLGIKGKADYQVKNKAGRWIGMRKKADGKMQIVFNSKTKVEGVTVKAKKASTKKKAGSKKKNRSKKSTAKKKSRKGLKANGKLKKGFKYSNGSVVKAKKK